MNTDDKNEGKRYGDIDALLNGLFKETNLRTLFERRLSEIGISQTAAQKLMKIERRTLNGILDGTQKRAEISHFQKVALFLNMPIDEFLEIHSKLVENNFSEQNTAANKRKFIRDNFDLAVLRRAGFINDITDFEEIEHKIISFFGFSSIFEYKKRAFDSAFSAPSISNDKLSKSILTRDFWLTSAKTLAKKIDNPYDYERQALVEFFPQIKWFSTNEELGLINVIKSLFRIGITIVFQPRLSILYLRGATFSVNNKPVIVLTDYKGFYPTLWHCLVHELYHVLFDWEKINMDDYSFHVTNDDEELFEIDENELDADDFARKYFFSKEKMEDINSLIYNEQYVKNVAKDNNIHSSIIHAYYAFDNGKIDRMAWPRARRFMPNAKKCVFRLANYWDSVRPIEEIAKKLKNEIYN